METKGVNILENVLRKNQGADVMVYISHALYGNQKIKTKLKYIYNEKQVGILVGEQQIYINKCNIKNYGVKDGIFFADDIMEIKIKLNKAG